MAADQIQLLHGDCLAVLRGMADASVDSIVTDPPYGLSFMGKKWDYDVPAVEVWAECLRVLKPGGYLLAFAGTRTQHRMAVRIEDAGFEIRDMVAWVYGSGFPKSLNLGTGWGTALKPALEPITVARKPLIGTVAENVLTHGTGALNIDGCRVGMEGGTTRGANASNAGKPRNVLHGGNFGVEQLDAGRWPANFIHDGSEEVVSLFPNAKGGAYPEQRGAGVSTGFGAGQPTEGGARSMGDSGSAARFFYCAKASRAERDAGLEDMPLVREADRDLADGPGGDNPRNRSNRSNRNHHPTVKPIALMRYLCRLVTPPGGVVLDPFVGSGTTGIGAALEGFRFIGVEREAEYIALAERRIQHHQTLQRDDLARAQPDLFAAAAPEGTS